MSDSSPNSELQEPSKAPAAPKRKATDAGLPGAGPRPHKSVKRRASKALDEVECIVSESKRKKKWTQSGDDNVESQPAAHLRESITADSPSNAPGSGMLNHRASFPDSPGHVPHALYQDLDPHNFHDALRRQSHPRSISIPQDLPDVANMQPMDPGAFLLAEALAPSPPATSLPAFIKPLPSRYTPDDIGYLAKKGALTIPSPPLRNALLSCFVEFVHPYMPLLDVHELVLSIDSNDGKNPISLLLFQAIMFASIASVNIKFLKAAGYVTRRDARRDFFQKTRLLYDFDCEVDRISLIQSLLLMTYWYETPDDQKDSHHWMGIAVSLSHTIGLHRNPERSNMDRKRQRLWKRIWWSTFMRDRLIALGMRRPTRIKNEDFDVPMLKVDDFDIKALPTTSSCISVSCTLMQDTSAQRELAVMCIEKAKLCICISHVLSTQYSVLHNNHGVQSSEGSTRTTMMLVARKDDPESCGVKTCDEELHQWRANVAPEAEYRRATAQDLKVLGGSVVVNRSLLHMVYFATLSALHRPQVLPSSAWPPMNTAAEVLETSRRTVRYAATKITGIAQNLHELKLVRFMPTSGITVLLPAIIIHLLDIKAPDEATRRTSLQGFCQCMQILNKLRDIYAAADYSTAFLEAAIRKAEITIAPPNKPHGYNNTNAGNNSNVITSTTGLVDAGKRLHLASNSHLNSQSHSHSQSNDPSRLTPPPEHASSTSNSAPPQLNAEDALASRLNNFLASTPPHSEVHMDSLYEETFEMPDFEPDFDALINLDAAGEAFALDDGQFPSMSGMPQGETGFSLDMYSMMNGNRDEGVVDFGAMASPEGHGQASMV
ncbi:hypothetical protein MBLNU459_g1362t1 [Dothideomycetes sp. NU459]